MTASQSTANLRLTKALGSLSRSPDMDEKVYQSILAMLQEQEYDTEKLVRETRKRGEENPWLSRNIYKVLLAKGFSQRLMQIVKLIPLIGSEETWVK